MPDAASEYPLLPLTMEDKWTHTNGAWYVTPQLNTTDGGGNVPPIPDASEEPERGASRFFERQPDATIDKHEKSPSPATPQQSLSELPTIAPNESSFFGIPAWIVAIFIILPPILIFVLNAWAAQDAIAHENIRSIIDSWVGMVGAGGYVAFLGWVAWQHNSQLNRHAGILQEQGKRFDQAFQQYENRLDQTWAQLQTTTQAVLSKLDKLDKLNALDEMNRKIDSISERIQQP